MSIALEHTALGKKRWLISHTVCLLLVAAGLSCARVAEKDQAKAEIAQTLKEMDDLVRQHAEMAQELDKTRKELAAFTTPRDERWDWLLLHQYINLALPQPDGTRLFEHSTIRTSPKSQYYNAQAKEAYRLLENKRLTDNKNLDPAVVKENDIKIKKHLVQINIAAITERYSADLTPYYLNLKANLAREFYGADRAELQKLSDFKPGNKTDLADKGWLVEIRGYTYHEDGIQFVKTTFLENLIRFKDLTDLPENKAILDKPFQDTEEPRRGEQAEKTVRQMLMERVEKKKSLLFLYAIKEVIDPTPGVFDLIGNTKLNELLGGGVDPAPPGAVPKEKAVGTGVMRTEFIVLFVWQRGPLANKR